MKVHITAIGRRLLKLPYRARQLEYVRLILEHPISTIYLKLLFRSEMFRTRSMSQRKCGNTRSAGESDRAEVKFSAGMAVLDSDAGERRIGKWELLYLSFTMLRG